MCLWRPEETYRQLWAVQYGCWEPNLSSLEEQQVLFTLSHLSSSKSKDLLSFFFPAMNGGEGPEMQSKEDLCAILGILVKNLEGQE